MRLLCDFVLLFHSIVSLSASDYLSIEKYQYEGSKPNILFIVTDDLRYDALGYFDSDVLTPNIDELFRNGFHFTNAYSQASVLTTSSKYLWHILLHNSGRSLCAIAYYDIDGTGLPQGPCP